MDHNNTIFFIVSYLNMYILKYIYLYITYRITLTSSDARTNNIQHVRERLCAGV